MSDITDKQPRRRTDPAGPAVEWAHLAWLALPLGLVVAAFGLEVGAILLAPSQRAQWSDFVLIALATLGPGLPSTFLGFGSASVLPVRWPRAGLASAGALGVALLGGLAKQVISGAAVAAGAITPTGKPSLLFALWALEWAIPLAFVAFVVGRAAAGMRSSATDASSSRR